MVHIYYMHIYFLGSRVKTNGEVVAVSFTQQWRVEEQSCACIVFAPSDMITVPMFMV